MTTANEAWIHSGGNTIILGVMSGGRRWLRLPNADASEYTDDLDEATNFLEGIHTKARARGGGNGEEEDSVEMYLNALNETGIEGMSGRGGKCVADDRNSFHQLRIQLEMLGVCPFVLLRHNALVLITFPLSFIELDGRRV